VTRGDGIKSQDEGFKNQHRENALKNPESDV
jgi:hypothetical protein